MNLKKLVKNKKFQISLVVICILTVAYFVGGNDEVTPLDPNQMAENETTFDAVYVDSDEDKLEEDSEGEEENEDTEEDDQEENQGLEKKEIKNKEINQQEKVKQEQTKREQKVQRQEEEKKQEIIKEQKSEKQQIIADDNKSNAKKDKYKTDTVPKDKPQPKEWQEAQVDKEKKMTATLSISARSILNNMDMFDKSKIEVLPKDGVIYQTQKVEFFEGESVFDVLLRETQKNKIHMEFNMTPIYNSNYIEGINNLYEFDCGELSGWMYKVNGWFPNYGASRYELKDGDKIVWEYTCDLGRDIGGEKSAGGN